MAVIVHVGLHKTGSTWLQQEVFPNLADVTYVGGLARPWLGSIVSGDPVEPTFPIPTAGTVLWSSEVLAGPLWDPVPPELAAKRLEDVFPGATILMFTRDADEWKGSVYSQFVHEGGYLAPDEFWRTVPVASTGTDPARVVAAFEQHFPLVHVLRYEDIRASPVRVAQQVASLCDSSLAAPIRGKVHNRRLSRPGLAVLRLWNRWFRRSRFNPSPLVAVPRAGDFRKVLQRYIDRLVPDRWR